EGGLGRLDCLQQRQTFRRVTVGQQDRDGFGSLFHVGRWGSACRCSCETTESSKFGFSSLLTKPSAPTATAWARYSGASHIVNTTTRGGDGWALRWRATS